MSVTSSPARNRNRPEPPGRGVRFTFSMWRSRPAGGGAPRGAGRPSRRSFAGSQRSCCLRAARARAGAPCRSQYLSHPTTRGSDDGYRRARLASACSSRLPLVGVVFDVGVVSLRRAVRGVLDSTVEVTDLSCGFLVQTPPRWDPQEIHDHSHERRARRDSYGDDWHAVQQRGEGRGRWRARRTRRTRQRHRRRAQTGGLGLAGA